MKYCPNCGKELLEGANFCGECGTKIEKEIPKEETKEIPQETPKKPVVAKKISPVKAERSGKMKKKRPNPLVITLILIICGIFLAVWFLMSVFTTKPEASVTEGTDASAVVETTSMTTAETTAQTIASSSEEPVTAKYDDIIENAKRFANEGNYSESELELSAIPEDVLARPEYASVKKIVDEIHAQNQPAMEAERAKAEAEQKKVEEEQKAKAEQERKAKEEQDKKAKAEKKEPTDPVFVGEFAQWATGYSVYFAEGQGQSVLTIGVDGKVSKGSQTGKATVESYSGDVLSYETNEQNPTKMPATKTVHPNVRITITWEKGGSQVFYGYTSFTSRLVLTDGSAKGNGVNEVWITN